MRWRWVVFAGVASAALVLLVVPAVSGTLVVDSAIAALGFLVYAGLGGLIVAKRDGHLTGWLLLLLGFVVVVGNQTPYLPGLSLAWQHWVGAWVWGALFALFALLTLTFPSGRPPAGSGSAARVGRTALWLLPVLVVLGGLTETTGQPPTANPVGFLPDWTGYAAIFLVVLLFLGGTVSLLVRWRHSVGAERAQLTWVVLALVLLVSAIVATVAFVFGSIAFGAGDPGDNAWAPAFLVMVLFPTSFGMAILRYRLYDIDRIVSRTVSWSILTALVLGLYVVMVFGLRSLFPATGNVAVAASTLAVAAVFKPLRDRLQILVDRRFNRARFDRQELVDTFAVHLRSAVDLPQLVADVEGVVAEAMQPTRVGVWVRTVV